MNIGHTSNIHIMYHNIIQVNFFYPHILLTIDVFPVIKVLQL